MTTERLTESEFKWNWTGTHLLITEDRPLPNAWPYPNFEILSVLLTREAAEQLRDDLARWLQP